MEVVGVTMADMAEITPEEAGVTTLAAAVDGAKTTEMITVVWAAWVDLTHGVHKEEETILVGEKILVGSITLRVVTAEITLEAGVTTPAAADGATIPAETEMEAGTMAATEVAMEATKGVDPCGVVTTTTWYVLQHFLIFLPPNCANQVRIVARFMCQ